MNIFKLLATLTAIISVNQIVSITPNLPQSLYYLFFMLVLGIVLLKEIKITKFTLLMVSLYFAAGISIILNSIPNYYQAPLRLGSFILLTASIGPLFLSGHLQRFRERVLNMVLMLLTFGTVFSFLVYSLGLPVPQYRGFSGIFSHSMLLGPASGISFLACLKYLFSNRKRQVLRHGNKIFPIIAVLCFLVLLLAASRAAILATLSGTIFLLYRMYQHRLNKFFSIIIVFIVLVSSTFPLWADYTQGIVQKTGGADNFEELTATRQALWIGRTQEFLNSPVFGIGFARTGLSSSDNDNFTQAEGMIEPGTSWLAVLSMTGFLGFIPIASIFGLSFKKVVKRKPATPWGALLSGLLIFFITHMFAEGYIFSSGSFLFFFLWLLIGCISGYDIKNQYYK